MYPIITPLYIPASRESDRCPSCKNLENKKEICAHCSYEYKTDTDDDDFSFALFILAALIFITVGGIIGYFKINLYGDIFFGIVSGCFMGLWIFLATTILLFAIGFVDMAFIKKFKK